MMRILANDGIDAAGKSILENAGFEVDTQSIPQSELCDRISNYDDLSDELLKNISFQVCEETVDDNGI